MSTKAAVSSSTLIDSARRGERWAEEEIVRLIRLFARHTCGFRSNRAAPELHWEDVAQEAARAFFEAALHRFRPGSEQSYLYAIVRITRLQLARGAERRRRREEASARDTLPLEHAPESKLEADWILRRMDDGCRRLLERVFFEGASYIELAAELGIVQSSVRAKLARCVRRARELAS